MLVHLSFFSEKVNLPLKYSNLLEYTSIKKGGELPKGLFNLLEFSFKVYVNPNNELLLLAPIWSFKYIVESIFLYQSEKCIRNLLILPKKNSAFLCPMHYEHLLPMIWGWGGRVVLKF